MVNDWGRIWAINSSERKHAYIYIYRKIAVPPPPLKHGQLSHLPVPIHTYDPNPPNQTHSSSCTWAHLCGHIRILLLALAKVPMGWQYFCRGHLVQMAGCIFLTVTSWKIYSTCITYPGSKFKGLVERKSSESCLVLSPSWGACMKTSV